MDRYRGTWIIEKTENPHRPKYWFYRDATAESQPGSDDAAGYGDSILECQNQIDEIERR